MGKLGHDSEWWLWEEGRGGGGQIHFASHTTADLAPVSCAYRNAVADVDQVQFLALCSALERLILDANPIVLGPKGIETEGWSYRTEVLAVLPRWVVSAAIVPRVLWRKGRRAEWADVL